MLLIVLFVNICVYLAMAISTSEFGWDADTLLAWGGNLGELSLHGEVWRLFTATYLHAGFQHIIANMVLLVMIGAYIEPWVGSIWTTAIYTVCGIVGGLLSAFGHSDVVGVGASGSIAGLIGVITIFYYGSKRQRISGQWVAQIVGVNAVYSLMPGVDALAHLGGFVAGLTCGVLLLLRPTRQMRLLNELDSRLEAVKH